MRWLSVALCVLMTSRFVRCYFTLPCSKLNANGLAPWVVRTKEFDICGKMLPSTSEQSCFQILTTTRWHCEVCGALGQHTSECDKPETHLCNRCHASVVEFQHGVHTAKGKKMVPDWHTGYRKCEKVIYPRHWECQLCHASWDVILNDCPDANHHLPQF